MRRSLSEAPTPVLFPAASRSHDGFGHENWDHQLKLAVAWNRVDIARSEIFTDERPWKVRPPRGQPWHPPLGLVRIHRFLREGSRQGPALGRWHPRVWGRGSSGQ